MITVYNTLGRSLEAFEPVEPGRVGMYVCGPTVQSAPHLGHGRCAVAFDVVRRYLMWRGWRVRYVQNVTDVDDKIIANASQAGTSPEALARDMAARFEAGYRRLNVMAPDVAPAATEHIPEMIAMITRLMDRDLAYRGAATSTSGCAECRTTGNYPGGGSTSSSRAPGSNRVRGRRTR